MPTTDTFERLVAAPPEESQYLRELEQKLGSKEARYFLADSAGNRLDIPPSVFHILMQAVHDLSRGRSVAIIHYDHELTTQEAADLINVSRPHLIKLLDDDRIPYHKVGTHRRIRMGDLMGYKGLRDRKREEALQKLHQMSEDLGLYNEEP